MLIAIKEADRVVVGYLCHDYNLYLLPEDLTDPENLPITFSDSGRLVAFHVNNAIADTFIYDKNFINDACDPENIICALPKIKKVLEENKFPKPKKPKDFDIDNDLLICDDQHIYLMNLKTIFREYQKYVCCDTNHEVESGAWAILDETDGMPAEERFRLIAKYMLQYHQCSRYPIVVIDTKTRELKALYKEGAEYEYITKL